MLTIPLLTTIISVKEVLIMSNLIQTTTEFAFYIVKGYIQQGDILVDATCGNGHDTLSMAKTQPSQLYGFDIQPEAIESTKKRLISEGFENELNDGSIKLICDSHENIGAYIPGEIKAAVFNLGYLPGHKKDFTTTLYSTMKAVTSTLELLMPGGIMGITMYSGHSTGLEEKDALLSWSSQLDPQIYHTAYISMTNQKNNPPEILLITRKK